MIMRSSRNPWLRVAAAALCLLLISEIALRVLTDYDNRWNIRLGASKQYDAVAVFRNKPGYNFGHGFITNEHGYLATQPLATAVPLESIRVLYMGDSNSVMPIHHNYPHQVEGIHETELGVDVETVNTAFPGYASHNSRSLFESEVSMFDADHFAVYLGWNDLGQFGPEGLPYKKIQQGYKLSVLQRAFSHVYSIRFIYAF